MSQIEKWKTNDLENLSTNEIRFDCPRCGTKNTSILGGYQITSSISNDKNEFEKIEVFDIYACAMCNGISIRYNYSEFEKIIDENIDLPQGIPPKFSLKNKNEKSVFFPVVSHLTDIPDNILQDYNLMHMCFLVGSSQGVAVHYRRILDKIFQDYEDKYLTDNEKKVSNIGKRASRIAEKNVYFNAFNETIKDLKGIVSTIVHQNLDSLELISDLTIYQDDFEQLDRIIQSLIKVYELEFKDLPAIRDKSKKISAIKSSNQERN